MFEIKEVEIARILNPTAIDLGEYVINPFMGCEFSCLYCYVRSNQVVSRKTKPWGEFVEVRVNAPELLKKEIASKKPKTVLLGSTTECFQPLEKKYRITQQILEILNENKVYYVILTRSPFILEYLPLLKEGCCKNIYFTLNNFSDEFKQNLEPRTPDFKLRFEAVSVLLDEGIPVIPYFSPLLPEVSQMDSIFLKLKKAEQVDFEGLNFRLNNIREIIDGIGRVSISLKPKYERMLSDPDFYTRVWRQIKAGIEKQAKELKLRYNIYIHDFGGYFNNTYKNG